MIGTGIGISAAVVVGTTSLFGAGIPHNHAIKTPIQLEQTTQKDPETTVSIDSVHAYYGTISDIEETGILVQGLQDNARNDRGQTWYLKSDIAVVSGYTGDSA